MEEPPKIIGLCQLVIQRNRLVEISEASTVVFYARFRNGPEAIGEGVVGVVMDAGTVVLDGITIVCICAFVTNNRTLAEREDWPV